MQTIILEYQLTETEAVRAAKEVMKNSIKFMPIMPWLAVIFLAMALILAIMQGKNVFDFSGLLYVGAFLALFPVLIVWLAKRQFRKHPSANKTIRWTISEHGLKSEADGTETRFIWDKLIRVEERKLGFFLFTQPRFGYWIPKNSFKSDTDENNFRNLVRHRGIELKG